MSKLKIYACSGVGKLDEKYDYWTDNTNTACNTQAVNNLLSLINLNYVEAVYLPLEEDEILDRLDKVDLYSTCLYYAQLYTNNLEELHRAGHAIGVLVQQGRFECNDLTNAGRDANLDLLFDAVAEEIKSSRTATDSWMQWWRENVEDLNHVGLTEQQQSVLLCSGTGDVDYSENPDLCKYLNNASEYFLYTYFTDEQLKALPALFARKKKSQRNIYQYCLSTYKQLGGTQSSMDDIIRAGIISYFKETPENVVGKIHEEYVKQNGVGIEPVTSVVLGTADIIAIITLVFDTIVAIITIIMTYVAKIKIAETNAIDQEAAAGDCPAEEDYQGLDLGSIMTGGSKSTYLLVGAALLGIMLLRKKKINTKYGKF